MDKNAIRKYAVWARNELIERVSQKADQYEISADANPHADSAHGVLLTPVEKKQRASLISRVRDKGMNQIIAEVAYTWFNRFAALRFMEVNNYLPSRVRVFTNPAGEFKPEILSEAIHLDLDGLDMEKVYALKETNNDGALFKYLIITQCNALSSVLPGMFQKIEDYTELLFPDNLLRKGSVVEQMVTIIPENDWKDQVQIIGWLYQYYNKELKDQVFADIKRNKKITKGKIPAATQLFTPDWIVRYMVENSLGRLWLDGHPNEKLQKNWKYYIEEAKQEPDVQVKLDEIKKEHAKLEPTDIKCIDPCMGSGHILCYMFDVLMQIYEIYGYDSRHAAASIVENNLYGLDIDERASQLAYFAVMMKACQYDRRFLRRGIQPRVYAIEESNAISSYVVDYFVNNDPKIRKMVDTLISDFHDAKEYGSILNISMLNFDELNQRASECKEEIEINLYQGKVEEQIVPLIHVGQILAQKYHVVVTNPPYAGSKGLNDKLRKKIKDLYSCATGDLFTPFIVKALYLINSIGEAGIITPTSWLYNPRYSKYREYLINHLQIINLTELGDSAFEVGFGTSVFIFNATLQKNYWGTYIDAKNLVQEQREFYDLRKIKQYHIKETFFADYKGCKFSYKLTDAYREILRKSKPLSTYGQARAGLQTDNNDLFIRRWYEVSKSQLNLNHKKGDMFDNRKWFPHIKGGTYRKWYGNLVSVVNWQYDGRDIKNRAAKKYGSYTKRVQSMEFYFQEGVAWTHTTYSQPFSCRYIPIGVISNVEGPEIFNLGTLQFLVMGILNSKIMDDIFSRISDSIHYLAGELANYPIILPKEKDDIEVVNALVLNNISLSKTDWDSFEISWNFQQHPLIKNTDSIADAFTNWKQDCAKHFSQLKANEEELNRIFIDIYGLQEELIPEEDDNDVTIRKADLGRDIRSFISYAVGCMFGRYSLDVNGLAYAGGAWDDSKYKTFLPDRDGIIPITDDEYFEDDIVGRFVEFVKVVYGADTLEENLQFIADALSIKGSTPREVIRKYFLTGFYKDHCKIYQKRPIYWLFNSGKRNGFKCLIYMHRYQSDTLARIRTDYVHEQQARYRTAIEGMERQINRASTSERVHLNKQLSKLKNQAEEIRIYEEKIHHLADQMIQINLDDGVKHNYAIFQDVLAKIK